jgi:hypothetical protein
MRFPKACVQLPDRLDGDVPQHVEESIGTKALNVEHGGMGSDGPVRRPVGPHKTHPSHLTLFIQHHELQLPPVHLLRFCYANTTRLRAGKSADY